MALLVGAMWALGVAVLLGRPPSPARIRELSATASSASSPGALPVPAPSAAREAARTPGADWAPAAALGRWLRRLAGRPADAGADRRVGRALLAAIGLVPVALPLAALPIAWAVAAPALAARRAHRARAIAVADQLPDVVDLLVLTAAAGLPTSAALRAIGHRPGGPLGEAIGRAARLLERGATTSEALALLTARAGAGARPLADVLAAHDRYGTPLGPALERVGHEARARRRRHAEEAARRLPVTLLFPLVLTTLPAFALLTVVPLLAGSFGSLSP
jgi:tight adherence protein C